MRWWIEWNRFFLWHPDAQQNHFKICLYENLRMATKILHLWNFAEIADKKFAKCIKVCKYIHEIAAKVENILWWNKAFHENQSSKISCFSPFKGTMLKDLDFNFFSSNSFSWFHKRYLWRFIVYSKFSQSYFKKILWHYPIKMWFLLGLADVQEAKVGRGPGHTAGPQHQAAADSRQLGHNGGAAQAQVPVL